MPESPADTLMINIGGQLQIWKDDLTRQPVRSGTWQAEINILHILADHFNLSREEVRGYVTTGGTEGNLAGLWWAREYLVNQSMHQSVSHVLYISDQAHYSIKKIANILGLNIQIIESDSCGNVSLEKLQSCLQMHAKRYISQPIIFCATAGTTQLGGIDNVPAIKYLLENVIKSSGGSYTIHLDAALLGVALPILKPFGEMKSIFDCADSISISGHKLLGTTMICGVVLARRSLLETTYNHKDIVIKYVGGIQDTTVSGTRSGFAVMELHNALHALDLHSDKKRLKILVNQCVMNAKYLSDELRKIIGDYSVLYNSSQLIVVFPKPSVRIIADELEDKYGLMTVSESKFGICVMPSVDVKLINEFWLIIKDQLLRYMMLRTHK